MKTISDLKQNDLFEKNVFLRVDFNVAVDGDTIIEPFKIEAAKETIEYLMFRGARVALVSHIESIKSFKTISLQISKILGQSLVFVDECMGAHVASGIAERQLVLLENVRMHEGEKQNDPEFAKQLAKPFDIYINDAFGAAHRKHASVSAITQFLPSYAGFLMKKETETLSATLAAPAKGKVVLLGGAKIGTKLPVIRNFIDKAETILIGGALINNFYKFERLEVGKSIIDEESLSFLKDLPRKNVILPEDVVVSADATGTAFVHAVGEKNVAYNEMILDVGPKSAKRFADIIGKSEMVIWNGPMGLSEVTEFAGATRTVIEAIAASKHSIVGGGDTVAAVNALVPGAKFTYISTGGGAMLDFLGGLRLPALEALEYYK